MRSKRILFIVQNQPVPFDRRVWSEALAVKEQGYSVSVLCPNLYAQKSYEQLGDISVYRYRPPKQAKGISSYLCEYIYSLVAISYMSIYIRLKEGFDAIHACGPPDFIFVVALFHKLFGRKKYIFDHHDLSPELFTVRFGTRKMNTLYKLLVWLEKLSFRTADVVISTNESFRQVAINRGGKSSASVFVVRNGPNLKRLVQKQPNFSLKNNKEFLVCYVGLMAEQDGLELLLQSIRHIVHQIGKQNITFVLIGSGDNLDQLKQMSKDFCIEEYVVFTGRIDSDDLLSSYLSTADLCVVPDPKNELNDKCTLIKIAEYMAFAKPIVSYDLSESIYTAGEAALYATDNNTIDFAEKVVELIDNPEQRTKMGDVGKQRLMNGFTWEHSKNHLISAYDYLFKTK